MKGIVRSLENAALFLAPFAVGLGVFLITYDVALYVMSVRR